jgi:hypothetical protein
MTMRDVVFYVALVLGSIMILVVCWVFLQHQTLDTGGLTITVCAVILIGMSVWRNIDISVSQKGIQAKLEQVEAQVQTVKEQSTNAEKQAEHAHQAVRSLKHSLVVRDAQELLAKRGFDIFADGLLGPQTSAAIRQFQVAEGLDSTGELDERTVKKLGVHPL